LPVKICASYLIQAKIDTVSMSNIRPAKQTKFAALMQSIAATTALLVTAFFPAACNPAPSMTMDDSPGILGQLIQNQSINVTLSGLVTLNDHGQNITSFKEFGVKNVPLSWMDTTFMGNTTSNLTPHKQIIDHVHGIATADGRFLEHVSFWQEIKEDGKPDIVFDITVGPIPMDGTGNSTLAKAFTRTGDIKKYVLGNLDWGLLDSAGSVTSYVQDGVQFGGIDWGNAAQPPVLNIQFSK
jgi:hypothetical protein